MAVRYMGSKKALAPEIANVISDRHRGATVLDVFAGMCAVGTAISPRHRLLTNDIHAYAATTARALFTGRRDGITSLLARAELLKHFNKNKRALEARLAHRLRREDEVLTSSAARWRHGIAFNAKELERPPARKIDGLANMADYRADNQLFPYCLATSYFSSAYFGIRQSIELDSLRYAIDQAPQSNQDRYLAALIDAASHCAMAPGHFAQFFVPRDRKTFAYTVRIRSRSILERFFASLDSFDAPDCKMRRHNRVFNREATTLLVESASEFSKQNLVIYADPPYSRAQYSRYYHLLETLVLYDYPGCDSKGRYREDRHQTEFSQIGKVVGAMAAFAKAAAATDGKLYLSYPRNGLIKQAGADVQDILRSHFKKVSVAARRPLHHSTMGGACGEASHLIWEDIFYATN